MGMVEKIGLWVFGIGIAYTAFSGIFEEGFSLYRLIAGIVGIFLFLLPFIEAREGKERERRRIEKEKLELDQAAKNRHIMRNAKRSTKVECS